ncbi:MAG TPA: nuclear transport factor 2 family protein [Candidatus Binatia bacterium]
MTDDDLQRTLVELETARTRAWLERDRQRLAELLDDEFIEINYVGRITKQQVLDELFARVRLVALEPADYALLRAGRDAALLSYRCTETVEIDGQRISGAFHVGALYVRAESGWRLRSWQITPWQGAPA